MKFRLLQFFMAVLIGFSSLSSSGKEFIIYDRMDYVGKPDLTPDKLSKVFLVYESELIMPDPTGKRKHGILNENRIRSLAKQSYKEGYRTISTDIETWFAAKDGQLLSPHELKADFEKMYRIFKEENPHAYISNYGLPGEHLNAIRHYRPYQPESAIIAKWQETNKRRHMSAAISDYANPVLYITDPDLEKWEKDVRITVEDIKKRFPKKKIIAYLWPQYYSASGSPYFKQFIDPMRWRQMLDISYQYTDGVIIWSDKRDESGKIVKWEDPRLQGIMIATKQFISAHPKEIVVEGLQPPHPEKRKRIPKPLKRSAS